VFFSEIGTLASAYSLEDDIYGKTDLDKAFDQCMAEGVLMALFDDQEKLMAADDGQAVEDRPPEVEGGGKYIGLVVVACTLPVVFLFWTFGTLDMGLNAGFCLGSNIWAVLACWDLRRQWWFWCVVTLMLALNIPLIVMIHWPHRWVPRVALIPIGLADMLITIGVVRFVQKFIVRSRPPSDEA
jgi:hypothetical protein